MNRCSSSSSNNNNNNSVGMQIKAQVRRLSSTKISPQLLKVSSFCLKIGLIPWTEQWFMIIVASIFTLNFTAENSMISSNTLNPIQSNSFPHDINGCTGDESMEQSIQKDGKVSIFKLPSCHLVFIWPIAPMPSWEHKRATSICSRRWISALWIRSRRWTNSSEKGEEIAQSSAYASTLPWPAPSGGP